MSYKIAEPRIYELKQDGIEIPFFAKFILKIKYYYDFIRSFFVFSVKNELMEKKQLPMGLKEFNDWSDRIIAGALVPGASVRSQKFALANLITHLNPTESFKEDAYFIHALRKTAANQVAVSVVDAIKEEFKKEAEAEKAKAKASGDGPLIA